MDCISPLPYNRTAMRVLMLSKALVVGAYQRKCELIAAHEDIQLTVLVPPGWRTGNQVANLERIHTSGYELRSIPIRLNGNFHLHYYPTLRKEMQSLQPDIVHIDEEPYNLSTYLALRHAHGLRAKTVFFTWQNLQRSYPLPFNLMERFVLGCSDYALAGSCEAKEVLRAKGYQRPLHVVPQFGVDPEQYCRRAAPERNTFNIGYAGRLVREKGVELLLQALANLPSHAHLYIIGAGDQEQALRALTTQLQLDARVQFKNSIPSSNMPAAYSELDALVLPSRTQSNWKEQFGRVLIEAMACGVPVVGSTCGEIPHVIGDAGLVFAEGDVNQLTERLHALLTQPALRTDSARRGRQRVLDHFTMQRIADETVAVYRAMQQNEK